MPEYVENRDIDRIKWDKCIERSCFETIYPYSWYLDLTAAHWDGIIGGDYEAVFPVTWNMKHGIHYIFQPLLTQQLGLFSADVPTVQQLTDFLSVLPRRFRHVEINLNASNSFSRKGIKVTRLVNYELDLSEDYAKIQKDFSTNTNRNIRKSEDQSLLLRKIDTGEYMVLKKRATKLKDKELEARLYRIFSFLDKGNNGEIRGAFAEDRLCAAVVWAFSRTRRIYLNSVSDQTGKEMRAMFLLVNDFIKRHSGKPIILDFEGSMISGIARFFEGFGASRNDYTRIRKSSFPLNLVLK